MPIPWHDRERRKVIGCSITLQWHGKSDSRRLEDCIKCQKPEALTIWCDDAEMQTKLILVSGREKEDVQTITNPHFNPRCCGWLKWRMTLTQNINTRHRTLGWCYSDEIFNFQLFFPVFSKNKHSHNLHTHHVVADDLVNREFVWNFLLFDTKLLLILLFFQLSIPRASRRLAKERAKFKISSPVELSTPMEKK